MSYNAKHINHHGTEVDFFIKLILNFRYIKKLSSIFKQKRSDFRTILIKRNLNN